MLYRYIVSNFLSYKGQAELTMFPQATSEEERNKAGMQPSPIAVIMGANASGKSNLIKSIDFSRDVILGITQINSGRNLCYKLDEESVTSPTLFSYEIVLDGRLYQYGFAVQFNMNRIEQEWLVSMDDDQTLMERAYDETTGTYQFQFAEEGWTDSERQRMRVYEEDWQRAYTQLVLTDLVVRNTAESASWAIYREVFQWFKNLTVIFPDSHYNLLIGVTLDERKVNEMYKEYFELFDIRIENIHLNEVPLFLLNLPQPVASEVKKDLMAHRMSDNQSARVLINHNNHEYQLELNNAGELVAKEVQFRHLKADGKTTYDFAKYEESDGTQRLFDLIPALARLVAGKGVFVIDEIDNRLHSLLTRHLLATYLEKARDKQSQLICTTHEQSLMDATLLRPDEIWMVQRENEQTGSVLYPLSKYKVRFPENLEKNYLLGRYQGVPVFHT
ncbi:transporter [gut metagenome]|uniref:Transporter n=1 Tax=gut metagenome TaxID=749906 RepID=J9H6B6_9ZZZZ